LIFIFYHHTIAPLKEINPMLQRTDAPKIELHGTLGGLVSSTGIIIIISCIIAPAGLCGGILS